MSLWRKRGTGDTLAPFARQDGQKTPKLFTMTATTDNDLSIKSDDLSIKQSKGIDMSIEAMKVEGPLHVVCKCDKCKAQPEQNKTYVYASSLATAIWQKHYMKESPKFALLDTTEGVLTQIDNMTCGLVREKPAQPEQEQGEPVATKDWEGAEYWMPLAWELCADECGEDACNELIWEGSPIPEPWGDRWLKYEDDAKRLIALVYKHTTPQQRTWVGLTDDEQMALLKDSDGKTRHWLVWQVEAKLKEKNA